MATRRVDLVVVGAGPAGLSTALHLQRRVPALAGRMVVLDKARFPREKICAGAIGARGLNVLGALGITLDVPLTPLNALLLRIGGQRVSIEVPALGVVVRRLEFDDFLVRAALARGIDIRQGCAVEQVRVGLREVRVETQSGDVYLARAVVGADGVGGVVRRDAGFPPGRWRAQAAETDTVILPTDAPRDTLVFDFETPVRRGYAWSFPTLAEGLPQVSRGVYVLSGGQGRSGAERSGPLLKTYLASQGLDPSGHRLKYFAEQGFEPGSAISRSRVLLVGESAGIDSATGEGIAIALEYGRLAAGPLATALRTGDFRFVDWRHRVETARLGWRLRLRHLGVRAFYDHQRARIERMVPEIPTLLDIFTRDFAGRRPSLAALIRGTSEAAWALATTCGPDR